MQERTYWKPWMEPLPGETGEQRKRRLYRTCVHCGREDTTTKTSLEHEMACDRSHKYGKKCTCEHCQRPR